VPNKFWFEFVTQHPNIHFGWLNVGWASKKVSITPTKNFKACKLIIVKQLGLEKKRERLAKWQ